MMSAIEGCVVDGHKKNSTMPEVLCPDVPAAPQISRPAKALYRIEPLEDPRWDELLKRHPSASVFHSRPWLEALRRTYGYESFAYTTSAPGEDLQSGLVFCRVASWLTGRRLVSVPFSDYCEPLVDCAEDTRTFLKGLKEEAETGSWRYVEIRPVSSLATGTSLCHATAEYTHHQLDLRPDLETLFRGFHRDSIQRKIKRAMREGVTHVVGTTEAILDAFYRLLVVTRRRHGVPPQPKIWFRNLIECFGDALQICVAYKGQTPLAGMLTLRYKDTMVYKYGGSDTRFNSLGSMHSLYWESIQRAKSLGLRVLDLGRSDAHQSGLITFKSRWGATESKLTYLRFTSSRNPLHMFEPGSTTWKTRAAKSVFSSAPAFILPAIGGLLYKHIG
jgi:CelD/BcsL family acetyltransferase involved in cellulose biosynthesis